MQLQITANKAVHANCGVIWKEGENWRVVFIIIIYFIF